MSTPPNIPDKDVILNEIIKEHLKTKYSLSDNEIKKYLAVSAINPVIKSAKMTVPVTVFNDVLSPLEAIVKYLKEVKELKLVDIAKLTGRDQRAIGVTCRTAVKKMPESFRIEKTKYCIPIELLKDKKLTVAEHIVKHIKESYDLNYHEVAVLLKRDDRTVWTLYKRASQKIKKS